MYVTHETGSCGTGNSNGQTTLIIFSFPNNSHVQIIMSQLVHGAFSVGMHPWNSLLALQWNSSTKTHQLHTELPLKWGRLTISFLLRVSTKGHTVTLPVQLNQIVFQIFLTLEASTRAAAAVTAQQTISQWIVLIWNIPLSIYSPTSAYASAPAYTLIKIPHHMLTMGHELSQYPNPLVTCNHSSQGHPLESGMTF